MNTKNLLKNLLPVGALLAFTTLANATAVPAGSSGVALGMDTVPSGSAVLASTGGTLSTTNGLGNILTITYTEWVYQDSGSGDLDFVIQATDDSSATGPCTLNGSPSATCAASNDIIDNITTSSFTGNGGVTTDLGYNTSVNGGASLSGTPVQPATGSNIAGIVGFAFNGTPVLPGQQTDYLIIKTNATAFVPGTVSFIDTLVASGAGYGVAPEPNMTALLSLFALGIIGVAYRRKKNVVKNTEVQ